MKIVGKWTKMMKSLYQSLIQRRFGRLFDLHQASTNSAHVKNDITNTSMFTNKPHIYLNTQYIINIIYIALSILFLHKNITKLINKSGRS